MANIFCLPVGSVKSVASDVCKPASMRCLPQVGKQIT